MMTDQAVPLQDNSIPSCRRECANATANCLRVDVGSTERAGLRRLQQSVAVSPRLIKKADILAMFNQVADDCERGDTSFESGYVENVGTGRSCNIRTSLPGSEIIIQLPQTVRGRWSLMPPGNAAIFEDGTTRASIHFTDRFFESAWGGDIKAVFSEPNNIVFSVGSNSCINAILQ